MLKQLKDLEKQDPKNQDNINSRKKTLINIKILYNNRKKVIQAFETGIFANIDGLPTMRHQKKYLKSVMILKQIVSQKTLNTNQV